MPCIFRFSIFFLVVVLFGLKEEFRKKLNERILVGGKSSRKCRCDCRWLMRVKEIFKEGSGHLGRSVKLRQSSSTNFVHPLPYLLFMVS